ncbi:MAG: helix-turn-helix transcriptional regulator [Micrococcaceae bacterium]
MDHRAEVRDFLITRRERITPTQVGLPTGGTRKVKGLRRSEVALLAEVSVEYYTKLERGQIGGASPEVLHSVARALQLDEAERSHLFDLAAAASRASPPRKRRSGKGWTPSPGLQWTLEGFTAGPAFVRNGRMDLLASNALARAFYSEVYDMASQPPNLARYAFLDERSRVFYPEREAMADVTAAILRTEASRDPHNKDLHDLIGELSTRSEDFRTRWSQHNVRHHGSGIKNFRHPDVGDLTLAYEGMSMEAQHGLTLTTYVAEPGSPSNEGLRLLASWAASNVAEQH